MIGVFVSLSSPFLDERVDDDGVWGEGEDDDDVEFLSDEGT